MHKNTHTTYLTITLKRRGKKEKRKKVKPDEKSIGEANSHCSSIILFLPHLATTLRTAYRFNLYMLLNSKYRSRLKQYCYHWDWYWALVERTPLINNWFVQQNFRMCHLRKKYHFYQSWDWYWPVNCHLMPPHFVDSHLSLNWETDPHIPLLFLVHANVEIHANMAARSVEWWAINQFTFK